MYKFVVGGIGIALSGFIGYMLFLVQGALPEGMKPIAMAAAAGFILIVLIWAMSNDDQQVQQHQPR